jgi:ParB family chromosome partitioning protein
MQPILVRFTRRGYELIAGERRWRACRMAGMTHIDAILTDADDATTACMAMVENLQRENLHFFEEAESYVSLMRQFGLTQDELAGRLGRNQSTVANKLRVLRLPAASRKRSSSPS